MTNTVLGLWFDNNICNGEFPISNNIINSFYNSIFIQSSENFKVHNNTLTQELPSSDAAQASITILSSEGYTIRSNQITGTGVGNGGGFIEYGIFHNASTFGIDECNTINGNPNSIWVIGINDQLDLIANKTINIVDAGIKIGGITNYYTYIDPQYKNGNRFLDNVPQALELDAPETEFTITNSSLPMFNGADLIPNPTNADLNIVSGDPSEYEYSSYCLIAVPPPDFYERKVESEDFGDIWINAMNGYYDGKYCYEDSNYCGGTLFDIQLNILAALYHNPDLFDEVDNTSQFWNDKMNTPLGELFSIDKAMENITAINQLDQLQANLSEVSTNKIYEANFKDALNLRIDAFKQGRDWSQDEINLLESIANQCPNTGGKGVGLTRGLLGKDFRDYDDSELCGGLESRSEKSSKKNIGFISPNPVRDYLDISLPYKFENGSVRIFNPLGQIVFNKTLNKNDSQIRIKPLLKSGIYTVNVVLDNRIAIVDKIEIIK